MSTTQIIKQPPVKRTRRKRKEICYVMTRKNGVITIATTLPKIPLKGGS